MRLIVYPAFRSDVHGVCVNFYYPDIRSLIDYLPDYIVSQAEWFVPHMSFFIPDTVIPSSASRPPHLVVYDAFSLAHVDLLQSSCGSNNNPTNRKRNTWKS